MTEWNVTPSRPRVESASPTSVDGSKRKSRSMGPDLDTSESKDSVDNDVKLAKEMALAIQNNPNLTPSELRELMAQAEARRSAKTQSKKSPLLKQISKGVKSSVKKAFKAGSAQSTPERDIPEFGNRNSVRLDDFLEGNRRSLVQDAVSEGGDVQDAKTLGTTSADNAKIRITGIIWKRRSGLGKYSSNSAWERRRVILKGNKLCYYRTNVDDADDDAEDEAAPEAVDGDPSALGKSKSWFDTMAGTKASKKEARGYLDLVKEGASVGASFGHSGSPTPFSLSIKVMGQTKWKLCFDTHGELMQWLGAMTDVIVQGSVDDYNAAILAANDPSRLTEQGYLGQLSEPPLIANSGTRMGGHRLWVTGHYKIQSENYPDGGLEGVSDDELEVDTDFEDDATHVGPTSQSTTEKAVTVSMSGGEDVWSIPSKYIWQWGVLWNIVIVLARASWTTVESFWYLITFANILLFGAMTKKRVDGKADLVSTKKSERLSVGDSTNIRADAKRLGDAKPQKKLQAPVAMVKPKAGTTSMCIENPMDLPVNKDGHVFAGWRLMNPEMMMIRSHNYKKDKIKVPSPGQLYMCVHIDIFESRQRYPDMASRVQIPEVSFEDDGVKTWNAPDVFVVSIAIPTDPPKLYNSSEDGGGYTITAYFVMQEETREILKRVTSDGYDPKTDQVDDVNRSKVNAVRLLDEWCRRAPTDDAFCARFKVLPNAQNLKEIGLPSWISKYNGKPFLIKRPGQTGFLYRHPEKSCMEFDISLHPFPYLAKQGINFMKESYFKKVLVTFGFLIEGRAEDELPECLIGLMQLCYPDPIHAIQGEDLMAGTSPKSFE